METFFFYMEESLFFFFLRIDALMAFWDRGKALPKVA